MVPVKPELIQLLLLSILADRLFGEPPDNLHPTVWMGKLISSLEHRLQSGSLLLLTAALPFPLLTYLILHALNGAPLVLAGALIFKTTFAWRALSDYTKPIAEAVARGDLASARLLLPYVAGRDPSRLDDRGLVSATVESIAESSVDSVLAPFFYLLILSPLGLEASVAAAVFYRASNTLDSMVGRPGNPLGSTPARIDELLNLLPARLGAMLLLLSTLILRRNPERAFKTYLREKGATPSRNAGQTISVMAGALGVTLEKPGYYTVRGGDTALSPAHIYEALRIVDLQIAVFTTLMVIAWM